LAKTVAEHLHAHDALGAHARDELGLDPEVLAKPVEAAVVSALSFAAGSLVSLLTILLFSSSLRIVATLAATLVALASLGAIAATLGGAPRARSIFRIVLLGIASMAITAVIGKIAGTAV
jgi:vacuolar iron transporter family protein